MSKRVLEVQVLQTLTSTTSSSVVDLGCSNYGTTTNCFPADTCSIENIIDVNTPGAKTWNASAVNTTDDTITITAHGFSTGLKGQVTTAGTLPAPLALLTNYFVIVVDANTIKLATTLNNAIAGTAIDLTTQGVGNSTFTPTALAGGSIKYEISNDNVNFSDYAAATNVTADTTSWFLLTLPSMRYVRWTIALTAGQMGVTTNILINGEG